jgi:tetratricopeptide (TPR) repeat protein
MKKFTLLLLVTALILGGLSASCGPSLAEQHFNRGLTLYDQEQFDEAEDEFTKAIELDPNFAKAYLARAIVRLEYPWDFGGAIADLEKCIALSDDPELTRHAKALLDSIVIRN